MTVVHIEDPWQLKNRSMSGEILFVVVVSPVDWEFKWELRVVEAGSCYDA